MIWTVFIQNNSARKSRVYFPDEDTVVLKLYIYIYIYTYLSYTFIYI